MEQETKIYGKSAQYFMYGQFLSSGRFPFLKRYVTRYLTSVGIDSTPLMYYTSLVIHVYVYTLLVRM
jgi:hypothetical protein